MKCDVRYKFLVFFLQLFNLNLPKCYFPINERKTIAPLLQVSSQTSMSCFWHCGMHAVLIFPMWVCTGKLNLYWVVAGFEGNGLTNCLTKWWFQCVDLIPYCRRDRWGLMGCLWPSLVHAVRQWQCWTQCMSVKIGWSPLLSALCQHYLFSLSKNKHNRYLFPRNSLAPVPFLV